MKCLYFSSFKRFYSKIGNKKVIHLDLFSYTAIINANNTLVKPVIDEFKNMDKYSKCVSTDSRDSIGPNNKIPTESEMPPYPDLGALKVESKNQILNNLKVEIITSKWPQCHSFEFPSRLVSMKIKKTI